MNGQPQEPTLTPSESVAPDDGAAFRRLCDALGLVGVVLLIIAWRWL
jgi:hypothetical protein